MEVLSIKLCICDVFVINDYKWLCVGSSDKTTLKKKILIIILKLIVWYYYTFLNKVTNTPIS